MGAGAYPGQGHRRHTGGPHRLEQEHHLHRHQEMYGKRRHRAQRARLPVHAPGHQGRGGEKRDRTAHRQDVRRLQRAVLFIISEEPGDFGGGGPPACPHDRGGEINAAF